MLRGLIALLRIAREVRRIRQILEIIHRKGLYQHSLLSKSSSPSPSKLSDIIIDTSPYIKRDEFGEPILEEDEEESEI